MNHMALYKSLLDTHTMLRVESILTDISKAKAKVTDNPEPSRLINVDDVQAGDIVSIERIPVQIHSCERRARYNHITIFSQALWGDFTIRRSVFTREVFNQIGLYYTKREISHGVFPPLVPGSFFLFNTSRYYKVVGFFRRFPSKLC